MAPALAGRHVDRDRPGDRRGPDVRRPEPRPGPARRRRHRRTSPTSSPSVSTTMLRFLVNALLVMICLGIALAIAGWLAGATPSGRKVRDAIAGAAHRWGSPLADGPVGRFTSEHPMFVPTLRAHRDRPGRRLPDPGRSAQPVDDPLDVRAHGRRAAAGGDHRGRGPRVRAAPGWRARGRGRSPLAPGRRGGQPSGPANPPPAASRPSGPRPRPRPRRSSGPAARCRR